MLPQVFAFLLCFVLQATARRHRTQTPFRAADEDDGCPTGVHVVGIRGTLEDPGFGAMSPLVEKLLADIPDSDSFAVDYPAAGITIKDGKPVYEPLKYIRSVQEGRNKLAAELQDINIFCPNTSVVLMGYSQGAHVSGDVLCGSTFPFFPEWTALEDEYKANIKAFVTLGDPRNNLSTPVHVGNSTKDGIFTRSEFDNCGDNVLSSWKTYCDATDVFCDQGESVEAHLKYVPTYFDDIIDHIKSKLQATGSEFSKQAGKSCEL